MMKMTQFDCDGDTVEFTIGDQVTWMEVADKFYFFLLASGYQLSREDLGEYYGRSPAGWPSD